LDFRGSLSRFIEEAKENDAFRSLHTSYLTNRSSQPPTGAMSRFDFMKQLSMFAMLAATSRGLSPSR
jgi:hypothetical protein